MEATMNGCQEENFVLRKRDESKRFTQSFSMYLYEK